MPVRNPACFDRPTLSPVAVLVQSLGETGQQKEDVILIDGRPALDQR